jgi:hypothetical protein
MVFKTKTARARGVSMDGLEGSDAKMVADASIKQRSAEAHLATCLDRKQRADRKVATTRDTMERFVKACDEAAERLRRFEEEPAELKKVAARKVAVEAGKADRKAKAEPLKAKLKGLQAHAAAASKKLKLVSGEEKAALKELSRERQSLDRSNKARETEVAAPMVAAKRTLATDKRSFEMEARAAVTELQRSQTDKALAEEARLVANEHFREAKARGSTAAAGAEAIQIKDDTLEDLKEKRTEWVPTELKRIEDEKVAKIKAASESTAKVVTRVEKELTDFRNAAAVTRQALAKQQAARVKDHQALVSEKAQASDDEKRVKGALKGCEKEIAKLESLSRSAKAQADKADAADRQVGRDAKKALELRDKAAKLAEEALRQAAAWAEEVKHAEVAAALRKDEKKTAVRDALSAKFAKEDNKNALNLDEDEGD